MVTPLEAAEKQVKIERAKQRLTEFETAFETVKQEILSAETVEDLVKVMSRYVAKINNARSVLKHAE